MAEKDVTVREQPRSLMRRVLHWADGHRESLGLAATAIVLLLCGFALNRLLAEMRVADVGRSIANLPGHAVGWSLLFTGLSYITLVGYDWSALRYVGRRLPARVIALASFCGYAIGNTVGFSLFTGGSVRFRIYSAAGLPAEDIGRVTLFCIIAFGFGICAVGGVGVLLRPLLLAEILHLPALLLKVTSVSLIVAIIAFVLLCTRKRLLRWRRMTLPLPSPSLVAGQLTISAIDLCFACAALWVLLPADLSYSFFAFLPLYCVAIVAGILSHVPGGLGVFEAVFVYALGDRTEIGPLVGALVVYRLIYYVMPLLVAGALLGLSELRRQIPATVAAFDRLVEVTGEIVPTFAGVFVVLAGIVLLASAATPMSPARAAAIGSIVSLPVIETAHFVGAMVASMLIFLAPALQRRLHGAYWLVHALLVIGIACSLAKGLDYGEAIALALIAVLLVPYRDEFYRRTSLLDEPLTLRWTVTLLCILGGAFWLMLFAYKHAAYHNSLWMHFTLNGNFPRSLRAMFAAGLGVVILAALHVMHPPRRAAAPAATSSELERARAIAAGQSHTDALLLCSGDKSVLFSTSGRSFLMLSRRGHSWIALFDPVGPPHEQAELIWRFRETCDREQVRPAFYLVRPGNLRLYVDVGLTVTRLGDMGRVPLDDFDLDQPANSKMRFAVNRGARDGLSFRLLPRQEVPAAIDALAAISRAWLAERKMREPGFSAGAFSATYVSAFDVAAVMMGGEIVAFGLLLRTSANDEVSIEMVRWHPDAPASTLEYLFVATMLQVQAQGATTLVIGMAPLSEFQHRQMGPLQHRLGALVAEHGEQFFTLQGDRKFKEQFHPVWEPRYLASPGGTDPLIVLADAAALNSGSAMAGRRTAKTKGTRNARPGEAAADIAGRSG
ncbi:MAG: bifunctional lysylphosphatidylglycerol flippase/synthetase MprF [Rhodospirillales bacterium]